MKTRVFELAALLLIVAGSFSSCGKKSDEIDYSNIESLYAQPLSIIEKCVQGQWIKKGTHGGIMGWTPASDSVFIEIIGRKLNDKEFQWVKHTKQNWDWETPFDTYAIQYVGLDVPSFYFHSINNDSLNVRYAPNHACYDCPVGELWVRNE